MQQRFFDEGNPDDTFVDKEHTNTSHLRYIEEITVHI